jgi:hypothetical protein
VGGGGRGGGGGGGGATNSLVAIAGGILRGELLAKEAKYDEAIAALTEAVRVEDDMAYAEPEALPFAARHFLGAVQLEAKKFAEAELTYRTDLEDHPRNGWSLYGLVQALEGGGKRGEADRARAQLKETWVRADALLRGSRY